eukprot:57809-Amphidinium_carterae.1
MNALCTDDFRIEGNHSIFDAVVTDGDITIHIYTKVLKENLASIGVITLKELYKQEQFAKQIGEVDNAASAQASAPVVEAVAKTAAAKVAPKR